MAEIDLDYAKVTGRFGLSIADTPDPGDLPDIIWCDEGTVRITPLTTFTKVVGGSPVPWTAGHSVIDATIDSEGYLTHLGKRFIYVIDLTSEKVNPRIPEGQATHRVEFINVRAGGTRVDFQSAPVRLTAAGTDGQGSSDLTELLPVPTGASVPIVRGQQGTGIESATVEAGDLVLALDDGTELNAGPLPVGPGGSDEGVASYLADETSEARQVLDPVLSATVASEGVKSFARRALGISAAQPFLAALDRGVSDLILLNIGDSTSNDYGDAFGRFADNLRASYPTHTFIYRNWDYDTSTWTSTTTLQTGTGARTVQLYNAAVSGMDADYHLGFITPIVAAVQPDLVLIGHGHNMTIIPDNFRAKYQELVTAVMQLAPRAGVICTSQNPIKVGNTFGLDPTGSEVRANVIAQVARELGAGFIDILQAFKDFPSWETALMSTDGLHPTFADNGSGFIGYQVWADYISAHFVRDHDAALMPKPASPLAVLGANLLENADFSEIDILALKTSVAPSLISGWTAVNATVTREGTITETSVGSAIRITTTAAGAGGYIEQVAPLLDVRGQYVTLTVCMYVPAASDVTSGRIAISDNLGQTTSPNQVVGKGRDCFRIFTISRYIAPNASSPKVTIYSESGTVGGSSVVAQWASLTRGSAVPRRPAPRRAAADTIWIPASGFDAIGSPVKGIVGTRTPAWRFPDASLDNWIATSFQPPRGWGQYEVQIVGVNAGAGTGNVAIDLEQRTSTNSSNLTAAPSATKQIVSSTLAQNIHQVLSTRTPSVTGTGTFQMTRFTMQELFIRRNGTLAGDTLANDYAIVGVRLLRIT